MNLTGRTKPLAMATVRLVVQGDPRVATKFTVAEFERALGRTWVLRPLQTPQVYESDTVTEMRCVVTFGPDRGSVADLVRHVGRHLRAVAADIGASNSEIFDVSYTPLITPEA